LLPYIAGLASVELVPYPLHYDGTWHPDIPAEWPAYARALVSVAPNNPTGNFLKAQELAVIEEDCPALIVDEVFADFPLEEPADHVRSAVGDRSCVTFVLSGLSKVALLPQLKLAWCVVSGPARVREQALSRLELISDTFLSAATPVQHALPQLLKQSAQMRQRVRTRLAMNLIALDEAVRDTPLSRLKVEAGWSAIMRLPAIRDDAAWALHFVREAKVIVQPGYFYDLPFCACVLSLLTPPAQFREGLARIRAAVG
jgi:aspartate/methionine/tyrosine aminotransferase